ncbi:MAG TPA: rod shape-determining protein MreC [Actinomycetota bacterium]|nr:rod shape-determining protein MreC [Actinomycetota bacterium]
MLLLVFLALAILVITLDYRQGPGGPLERAKDFSVTLVAPIQRGFTTIFRPVGNFFSSIGELGSLRSKNEDLEEQLEQAQADVREAEALVDENQRLTDLLDLENSWVVSERVTARVIATGPKNLTWAAIIDKGRADGIRPDMAVIAPEGLVGKVYSVGTHQATILYLVDPRGAASARIDGGRDAGIVSGRGAGDPLEFDLVGVNADAEVGDRVVTAGYDGGIFPAGIPIGLVVDVGGDARQATKDIDVEPYVDFTALDFVQVLVDSGPKLSQNEGS